MKNKLGAFIIGLIFSLFILTLPTFGNSKPNILFIMLDDLDSELLFNAIDNGLMPNFKARFVDQGIEFVNSFATTPVCGPSRASYLTGQLAHNHGVLDNSGENGGLDKLAQDKTLPTWLSNAGYVTSHVGKYVNGYGSTVSEEPVPPGWQDWKGLVDLSTYRVFNFRINENGKLVDYSNGEYQTNVLSDLASDFLTSVPRNRPFYLEVTPLAPHVELEQISLPTCKTDNPQAWGRLIRPDPKMAVKHSEAAAFLRSVPLFPQAKDSFNESDISDKPRSFQRLMSEMSRKDIECLTIQYRSRLASLVSVDDMIGSLFNTLREQRRLRNTIVIFTSDNGYLQGEHRFDTKLFAYNESLRIPLYVWTSDQSGNLKIDALINNIDVPVTIADIAGAAPNLTVDGRSFKTLIQQPDQPWRNIFLIEVGFPELSYIGLRSKKGMFLEIQNNHENELYNLVTDPLELENKADARPELVSKLRSLARRLANCEGTNCFVSVSL